MERQMRTAGKAGIRFCNEHKKTLILKMCKCFFMQYHEVVLSKNPTNDYGDLKLDLE